MKLTRVVPPGIEPGTQGFSVLCSTNWAMAPCLLTGAKMCVLFDTTKFCHRFFLSQIRYRVQRCDKFRIETSRGVLKFRFLPGIWFGSASVCSVCAEIREPVPVLQNRRNPILTDISCLLRRKLLPRSCYVFTKVAMKGDKIACRTAFEWLLV